MRSCMHACMHAYSRSPTNWSFACRLGCDVRGNRAVGVSGTTEGLLVTDWQAGKQSGEIRIGPLTQRGACMARKATVERRILFGLQPPSGFPMHPARSESISVSSSVHRRPPLSSSAQMGGELLFPMQPSLDRPSVSVFGRARTSAVDGTQLWRKCRRLCASIP
jgi:hypothetical protein